MKCPCCGMPTDVYDTRQAGSHCVNVKAGTVLRRRRCTSCYTTFKTTETIELTQKARSQSWT